MSESADHELTLSLPVDHATALRWLAGGPNQLEAQTEVARGCYHWLCLHRRGLSRETLNDVIWTSMTRAYAVFQEKQLSTEEALLALQRSLNTLRAQEDRRRQREESLEVKSLDRLKVENAYEEKEFWKKLLRLVECLMVQAFLSLSDHNQDILGGAYGLEELGEPVRQLIYPKFPSAAAEKKALTRARQRFNRNLESLIVSELEVRKFDRPLYEAALRLVRGGKAYRVLTLAGPKNNT